MIEANNFDGNYLDLTLKDVCFNCDNGFVLGNRKQLSLYSHLLRIIFEKCPNVGSEEKDKIPKKCIVLNTVMCEDLELLFTAVNKVDFIVTAKQKICQIRQVAKTLGMKLEESTNDDGFATFKVVAVNSETENLQSLEDNVEIANNPFSTLEVNQLNSESVGDCETIRLLTEYHTEPQNNFVIKDICFNCCDGIVFGNREQLSLYSPTLKQIFRDYPSIANDVSTPGIAKGIYLSHSYCNDVCTLFQTICTRDFVRLNSQRIPRIRNVAHVLGMKLNEFQSNRGFVWLRVAEAGNGDVTSNQKFDITEIRHNKSFEKEIVDVSNDSAIDEQMNEKIIERDNLDLRVKDICFNCEDGHILANQRQLTLYSAFLKQLFEEFPNIAFDNSLPYDNRGINLPSVRCEDIETLLLAMTKRDLITVNSDRMPGIRHAASLLQMNINEIHGDGAFVNFKIMTADSINFACDVWNTTGSGFSSDVGSNEIVTNMLEENEVSVSPMSSVNQSASEESCKDDDDDDDDDCKIIEGANESIKQHKTVTPEKYIGKARRSMFFKVSANEGNKQNESVENARKYRRNSKNGNSGIRCKCGKRFDNLVYFYKHRVDCDNYRKDAIICDICDNPFKNQFSLKIHKSRIHKGVKTQNECCCGDVFTFKGTLRNHQQTCDIFRRTALHCGTCNLLFQSQTDYFIHTNSRAHLNKNNKQLEVNF